MRLQCRAVSTYAAVKKNSYEDVFFLRNSLSNLTFQEKIGQPASELLRVLSKLELFRGENDLSRKFVRHEVAHYSLRTQLFRCPSMTLVHCDVDDVR